MGLIYNENGEISISVNNRLITLSEAEMSYIRKIRSELKVLVPLIDEFQKIAEENDLGKIDPVSAKAVKKLKRCMFLWTAIIKVFEGIFAIANTFYIIDQIFYMKDYETKIMSLVSWTILSLLFTLINRILANAQAKTVNDVYKYYTGCIYQCRELIRKMNNSEAFKDSDTKNQLNDLMNKIENKIWEISHKYKWEVNI